jgi:hypothetical protein
MLDLMGRLVVRLSVGALLGVAPGALYAALVSVVHRGTYGTWGRIPCFVVGCVVTGALLGLVAGVVWTVSGAGSERRRPA